MMISALSPVSLKHHQKQYLAAVLCHHTSNYTPTISTSTKSLLVRASARQREVPLASSDADLSQVLSLFDQSFDALVNFDQSRQQVLQAPSSFEEDYAVDCQELYQLALDRKKYLDAQIASSASRGEIAATITDAKALAEQRLADEIADKQALVNKVRSVGVSALRD
jgi:hypothetical protein